MFEKIKNMRMEPPSKKIHKIIFFLINEFLILFMYIYEHF